MYRPVPFREDRADVLAAAVRELQFATLVTLTSNALVALHIPLILKDDASGLRLEGHLARVNPQWKQMSAAVDALAIFLGPHAYISPTWYASKTEHQRVVPTWNYISIQATGPLSVIDDKEWLLRHINELTDHNESGQQAPWSVAEAPAEYVQQLASGIVGLCLQVRTLEGVWKMAQHKSEADRMGVIQGLNEAGNSSAQSVASIMQHLENERAQ